MIRQRHGRLSALQLAASMLVGSAPAAAVAPTRHASAVLRDATGATVGWALFSAAGARGVRVAVVAFGMSQGPHGLHIHAIGNCVAPDFGSAGPHFNPLGTLHGSHAGDLPDLAVGSRIGHLVTASAAFTLLPGQRSLLDSDGAALVVHANPDDQLTYPAGNSGTRIACGAIVPLGLTGSLGT